ncbi:hypothetical protein SDRG_16837 [Saprolegnia diclina VS20]|uniref:Serine protease n=1 Tax=Saprolegnia diclina (strain VS20) TaxID=1156394 RepID=T0QZX2_SAPDV|nr:hypothetical protein SDRG_16837 [Saprolegnia diclina VS20]EQC25283.1 hypothetical protein SDRG_16837 [Saprolegnia diclina VS20]|eukprot:XP_008621281.1 hypothetical protein SDRG_16837 [Saprolegnia diclina VS20]
MFSGAKLLTLLASVVAATQCGNQASIDVAVKTPLHVVSNGDAAFSQIVQRAGATFAAPHFKSINVPANGKLTITSLDGKDSVVFHGGESATNIRADWISGAGVVVAYEAPTYVKQASPVFEIDEVAFGKPPSPLEALCDADQSQAAACYASDAAKTKSGKAVARLLINGQSLCTGWLVGSEGHMLTNNHCIKTAAAANDVQVEFGAECKTCEDPNNQKQLACKGEIVATSATFLATSPTSDFTLVKLNVKDGVDLTKYGYLQVRPDGPKLNETIHIIGHAAGWPKRFAVTTLDGPGTVTTTSFQSRCQADEFAYRLDTQGGNSGSPVLSTDENVVVGLHNCGGCPDGDNAGIKINKVFDILKAQNIVIKDAVVSSKPAC